MKRLFFNFKITFKNVELVFWTFAFPIILVTLFYAAFSNITAADEYVAPKIAVIENENSMLAPVYKQVFENVEQLLVLAAPTHPSSSRNSPADMVAL